MTDITDDNVITLDPKAPRKGTGKRQRGGHPNRIGKVRRDAETLPGVDIATVRNMPPPKVWAPSDMVRLARQETEDNIKVLIEIRDDRTAPAVARACVVSMLFDRAYGRAPQMIAIQDITPNQGIDPANLSDEDLLLLDALVRKASGELPAPSAAPVVTIDHDADDE